MQIILLESLNKLGKAGDVVTVKDGYANNFLIPTKKAIVANKKNKDELDGRMAEINANNQKKLDDAAVTKSKINGINIDIPSEANDQGALYGTITQKQIIDAIRSLKGVEIKSEMLILNPIKSIGEFEVTIRHYENIQSQVKITVSRKS
jgi:ribosomal protein L9